MNIAVRHLGRVDYLPTYGAMRDFTLARTGQTADQIWLCEHPATYTQGLAGKSDHVLSPGDIPVIPTNRGGQVTYHGPGQVVAYVLVDLRRRGYGIRELVSRMEQAVIDLLSAQGVAAARRSGAPGVYVNGAKIAALGLRVKHGCTYHGLALNVDMDLRPFAAINPCGYPGLAVTDCREVGAALTVADAGQSLVEALRHRIESGSDCAESSAV